MLSRWVRKPDPGSVVLSATREGPAVMERAGGSGSNRRRVIWRICPISIAPLCEKAVGGRRSIE
jgi:hypothetical protein